MDWCAAPQAESVHLDVTSDLFFSERIHTVWDWDSLDSLSVLQTYTLYWYPIVFHHVHCCNFSCLLRSGFLRIKVYIKDFVQAPGLWKRSYWRTIGVKKVFKKNIFLTVLKNGFVLYFPFKRHFLTLLKKCFFKHFFNTWFLKKRINSFPWKPCLQP